MLLIAANIKMKIIQICQLNKCNLSLPPHCYCSGLKELQSKHWEGTGVFFVKHNVPGLKILQIA